MGSLSYQFDNKHVNPTKGIIPTNGNYYHINLIIDMSQKTYQSYQRDYSYQWELLSYQFDNRHVTSYQRDYYHHTNLIVITSHSTNGIHHCL